MRDFGSTVLIATPSYALYMAEVAERMDALKDIRLRVGLHEAGEGRCSDDGVILLQVCGEQDEVDRLMAALESTPGVTAKLMDLN